MNDFCSQVNKELLQFGASSKRKGASLRLKSEFDETKLNASKLVSRNFIMLYTKANEEQLRIGIICGRKFNKRAVTRNRVRRITKEAFRLIWSKVRHSHIILIPRRGIELLKTQDIQIEIITALKRTSLWIEE